MFLTSKEVKAVLQFVSDEPHRGALCGAYVMDGVIWATDGHTLVCRGSVPKSGTENAVFLPSSDLERACKLAGSTGTIEIVGGTETSLKVTDKAGTVTVLGVKNEGLQSPPIGQVVPTYDGARAGHVGINPAYLARGVKIFDVVGRCAECKLEFGTTTGDPVIMTIGDDRGAPTWTVVIMPVRLDADKKKAEAEREAERLARYAA